MIGPQPRIDPTIGSRHHCAFTEMVFQGVPVQNLYRSLACQSNNAAMLQIGNGPEHGLDRDCEIIGDIIARDRQLHLPPLFGPPTVKRKQKRADLLERSDAAEALELVLRSHERL